jgi:hypothetical protein
MAGPMLDLLDNVTLSLIFSALVEESPAKVIPGVYLLFRDPEVHQQEGASAFSLVGACQTETRLCLMLRRLLAAIPWMSRFLDAGESASSYLTTKRRSWLLDTSIDLS